MKEVFVIAILKLCNCNNPGCKVVQKFYATMANSGDVVESIFDATLFDSNAKAVEWAKQISHFNSILPDRLKMKLFISVENHYV